MATTNCALMLRSWSLPVHLAGVQATPSDWPLEVKELLLVRPAGSKYRARGV